jgi:HEAT repeat protein
MKYLSALIFLTSVLFNPAAGAEESHISTMIEILANGDDTSARLEAAKQLGQSGNSQAIAPLIKMLGESNRPVRWAAIEALGELQDHDAVPALLKYLERREAYRWGKILSVNALAACHDQRALAPLVTFLENSSDPILQRTVILALGKLGNGTTVPVVMPFLTDEREWIHQAAQDALIQLTEDWRQGTVPQGFPEWQQWYVHQENLDIHSE